jgi:26S proteasome regulatory subunit N6
MSSSPTNVQKVEEAKRLSQNKPEKSEALYKEVLSQPPGSNDAALKDYENALVGLGELYRDHKRQEDLAELVKASRSAIQSYAKAKTAKLGECSTRCERRI